MPKITRTIETEVPDGPVCENWAYRTDMPPEQKFRCKHYRRESDYVTDRDMGGAGSGGGYMYSSRCALFDWGLSDENGVGPHKCPPCLAACGAVEGANA